MKNFLLLFTNPSFYTKTSYMYCSRSLCLRRALFCVAAMLAIIFSSCRKENLTNQRKAITEEQLAAVLQWGEAANGRWVPYLLNKAKAENPHLSGEEFTRLFNSNLAILNGAEKAYRAKLLNLFNQDPVHAKKFMDSLYTEYYPKINGTLGQRGVLDSRWERFQTISRYDRSAGQAIPSSPDNPSAGIFTDPVTITACGIPDDVRVFTGPSGPSPIELGDGEGDICRMSSLMSIQSLFITMSNLHQPSQLDCSRIIEDIRRHIVAYYNCPGTPPGGGGGEPPVDPFPPVNPAGPSEAERLNKLLDALKADAEAILPCNELWKLKSYGPMYQSVGQFIPPVTITSDLSLWSRVYGITLEPTYLEFASGVTLNADFFPIKIDQMPTINPADGPASPESLLEHFRTNMNSFVDKDIATFEPYKEKEFDATSKWLEVGQYAVGTVLHLDMLKDGDVVLSDYSSNSNSASMTVSTIYSSLSGNHPVQGNRRWGVYTTSEGYKVFYTMGVDRISTNINAFGNAFKDAFSTSGFEDADKLWRTMQTKMVDFINQHGGQASAARESVVRTPYESVKEYLNGAISYDELRRRLGC